MLRMDRLSPYSTIITFDDGWHYTFSKILPIARDLRIPFTIYITSYYASINTSVLNVLIRYIAWKRRGSVVDLRNYIPNSKTDSSLQTSDFTTYLDRVLAYVEGLPSLSERICAAVNFADCLGFDGRTILNNPAFRLMNAEEIQMAATQGTDIQLHTHRHRFPGSDVSALVDEITQNRNFLEPLVGRRLNHLCYPSGEYYPHMFETLSELGIESAATCQPGLVSPETNLLALPRFLDGENIAPIEFEAEMSGALEIFRNIRGYLKRSFFKRLLGGN